MSSPKQLRFEIVTTQPHPRTRALFDSPVICEYVDSLNEGRKLFPAAGPARWVALRQQHQAGRVDQRGRDHVYHPARSARSGTRH
jgi:glutathione S-transferase